MLAVLNQHCRPDSVTNAFTTLMSLFNNVQGESESIVEVDLYIVNLLANKRALMERVNRLCARCCTQHLTHLLPRLLLGGVSHPRTLLSPVALAPLLLV